MKRLIIVGSPRVEGRSGALADLLFESCIEECPEDEVFLAPVSTLEVAGCNACDWCKRGSAVLPNGGDADVAATCGSASRGEAGDLRTEVRGAFANPRIPGTTAALADFGATCGFERLRVAGFCRSNRTKEQFLCPTPRTNYGSHQSFSSAFFF